MRIFSVAVFLFLTTLAYAQPVARYGRAALNEDLSFVVEKVKKVQNYPYTCCSERRFDKETQKIREQLKDSMSFADFGFLIRPLLDKIGDEHAFITWPGDTLFSSKAKNAITGRKSGYEKVGNVGVLTISSFRVDQQSTMGMWNVYIDSMFCKIREDKIEKLVIDVSSNSGGSSNVGNVLIHYFYPKEYKGYGLLWKRSDEYVEWMKYFGHRDSVYESLKCGEYMGFKGGIMKSKDNSNRFEGKVFVIVGRYTFSSAIMFATVVKDNRMAKLIGEVPGKGHPNHFGELITFQTPNTNMNFGFGVKRFLRPSGKTRRNILEPDVVVDLSQIKEAKDWLPYLK